MSGNIKALQGPARKLHAVNTTEWRTNRGKLFFFFFNENRQLLSGPEVQRIEEVYTYT